MKKFVGQEKVVGYLSVHYLEVFIIWKPTLAKKRLFN